MQGPVLLAGCQIKSWKHRVKHSNSILLLRFPVYTEHLNLENENKRACFHKNELYDFKVNAEHTEPSMPKLPSTLCNDGHWSYFKKMKEIYLREKWSGNKKIILGFIQFLFYSSIIMHSMFYCDSIFTWIGINFPLFCCNTHTGLYSCSLHKDIYFCCV